MNSLILWNYSKLKAIVEIVSKQCSVTISVTICKLIHLKYAITFCGQTEWVPAVDRASWCLKRWKQTKEHHNLPNFATPQTELFFVVVVGGRGGGQY